MEILCLVTMETFFFVGSCNDDGQTLHISDLELLVYTVDVDVH